MLFTAGAQAQTFSKAHALVSATIVLILYGSSKCGLLLYRWYEGVLYRIVKSELK
jgi:hypothetical protein